MYPLHLNYTNTLPGKTITMKITIFHKGIFGNTRILITNGQQTQRTCWLPCLESYAWTLQDISTQAKYHRRAEECLANNMWWSATELHQQGHTELCQKTSSLCESWGGGGYFEHVLKLTIFAGFRIVSKLWQSEMSNFHLISMISIQALWWKGYEKSRLCQVNRSLF